VPAGEPPTVMGYPIEGQVVLLAGAKASVPLQRLPALLERTQAALADLLDDYERRYELALSTDEARYFLVEADHWTADDSPLADDPRFGDRERDAVARAHEEQLLRAGRHHDRREEFETSMDIRSAVVIGVA
jgi:hypothetical protein